MNINILNCSIFLFISVFMLTSCSKESINEEETITEEVTTNTDYYTFGTITYEIGSESKTYTTAIKRATHTSMATDITAVNLAINDSTKFILYIKETFMTATNTPQSFSLTKGTDGNFSMLLTAESYQHVIEYEKGTLTVTKFDPATGEIKGTINGSGGKRGLYDVAAMSDLYNGINVEPLKITFDIQVAAVQDLIANTTTIIIN